MEQIQNLGDERQVNSCIYCGDDTETRDHVPSKVLLDEPYPKNLPVVPACRNCNNGFSSDEEYFACLVEFLRIGKIDIDSVKREKIKRILKNKPKLVSGLAQTLEPCWNNPNKLLTVNQRIDELLNEDQRIEKVFYKLGLGHGAFELNEPIETKPSSAVIFQLHLLRKERRELFETPPLLSVGPEAGSRAMQRILIFYNGESIIDWVTVQEGQYRYLATLTRKERIIRIVIGEHIGCEMVWTDEY